MHTASSLGVATTYSRMLQLETGCAGLQGRLSHAPRLVGYILYKYQQGVIIETTYGKNRKSRELLGPFLRLIAELPTRRLLPHLPQSRPIHVSASAFSPALASISHHVTLLNPPVVEYGPHFSTSTPTLQCILHSPSAPRQAVVGLACTRPFLAAVLAWILRCWVECKCKVRTTVAHSTGVARDPTGIPSDPPVQTSEAAAEMQRRVSVFYVVHACILPN